MKIARLDHLVLTVADIDATIDFYVRVLGMRRAVFGEARTALVFGRTKINLHQAGREFEPKSARPTPGSADLCLIVDGDLAEMESHLRALGVSVIEGPVVRTGAVGPITSIYVRDPDQNLIELSTYADPSD